MEGESGGHEANSGARAGPSPPLPLIMPPAMKSEGVSGPTACLFCKESGGKRLDFVKESSSSLYQVWSSRDEAQRLHGPVGDLTPRMATTVLLRQWFAEGNINLADAAGVGPYHPKCKRIYSKNYVRDLKNAKGAVQMTAEASPQSGPRRSPRFVGALSEWRREMCFICQVGRRARTLIATLVACNTM